MLVGLPSDLLGADSTPPDSLAICVEETHGTGKEHEGNREKGGREGDSVEEEGGKGEGQCYHRHFFLTSSPAELSVISLSSWLLFCQL